MKSFPGRFIRFPTVSKIGEGRILVFHILIYRKVNRQINSAQHYFPKFHKNIFGGSSHMQFFLKRFIYAIFRQHLRPVGNKLQFRACQFVRNKRASQSARGCPESLPPGVWIRRLRCSGNFFSNPPFILTIHFIFNFKQFQVFFPNC